MDNRTLSSQKPLNGEKGLVLRIIARATKDALGRPGPYRGDAWRYFASTWYEKHLAFLGLPFMLPQPLLEAAEREKIEKETDHG